jgi:microcin C transport system permease protein
MLAYVAKRLLLMLPTVFGVLLVTFIVMQFVPGGPVEQILAEAQAGAAAGGEGYRAGKDLDKKQIEELKKLYGFDKPAHERFLKMLGDYIRFDFGRSYFRDAPVLQLIKEKLPVSISLGLWMTLLSYAISIPLGIRKAVKDGSRFDTWTSAVVIVAQLHIITFRIRTPRGRSWPL